MYRLPGRRYGLRTVIRKRNETLTDWRRRQADAARQDEFVTARMRERNMPQGKRYVYPVFKDRIARDGYLDKLIGNGYQVKAVDGVDGVYTVLDIDRRKGK